METATTWWLDREPPESYTGGMEVRLSPELEAKPNRVAVQQGRDGESLVHEAVERLVDYDQWFLREVENGLAAADRGEWIDHEEWAR